MLWPRGPAWKSPSSFSERERMAMFVNVDPHTDQAGWPG